MRQPAQEMPVGRKCTASKPDHVFLPPRMIQLSCSGLLRPAKCSDILLGMACCAKLKQLESMP